MTARDPLCLKRGSPDIGPGAPGPPEGARTDVGRPGVGRHRVRRAGLGRSRARRAALGPTSVRRLALVVCAAVLVLASATPAGIPALGPAGDSVVPPFGVGERLEFDIKYGFVGAGTAIMSIPELVRERGYLCYRIVSSAESNAFFSVFFTVRDVAESYLDVRDLVSRRFEKRLREGDFRSHDVVLLDHDRNVAIYPKKKDRVIPLALDAQDILSSLYYVRMMDLEVGKSIYIENHADRKNYPLEIRVIKKERIKVPAGTFDCLVIEPIMRASGLFRHEGKLTVWLSDDARKIPVLMKSKVVIGSVSAVLTDVKYARD